MACDALDKKVVPGQDGKPCYIAGTGKCKQDGRHNPKAHLVCKTLGILIIYIQKTTGYTTSSLSFLQIENKASNI